MRSRGKGLGGRITPYGVTFHYAKDGTMGAIISSKLGLPSAGTAIVLNTPMRKSFSGGEEGSILLTEAATKALWAVELETRKYIAGKRAQAGLFGENGEAFPDAPLDDIPGDDGGTYEEGIAAMSAAIPTTAGRHGAGNR